MQTSVRARKVAFSVIRGLEAAETAICVAAQRGKYCDSLRVTEDEWVKPAAFT
jgi:hypothetical protein